MCNPGVTHSFGLTWPRPHRPFLERSPRALHPKPAQHLSYSALGMDTCTFYFTFSSFGHCDLYWADVLAAMKKEAMSANVEQVTRKIIYQMWEQLSLGQPVLPRTPSPTAAMSRCSSKSTTCFSRPFAAQRLREPGLISM